MIIPIVNIMQEVVADVSTVLTPQLQLIDNKITGIHYIYGHPQDIVEELTQKSKTEANKFDRYPLIGLFLDIAEEKGDGNSAIESTASLNGFIATQTSPSLKPFQRTRDKFIPILYPIYEELLRQITRHKDIAETVVSQIPHNKYDRYQWGKGGLEYYDNRGTKNIFNDAIDAVEFTDLKINFYKQCKK